MSDPTLFDPVVEVSDCTYLCPPPRPVDLDYRRGDKVTSINAARRNPEHREACREVVLHMFKKSGADGMTDKELRVVVGSLYPGKWESSGIGKRRLDLQRLGLVADSGRVRDGATVWVLA